MSPIVNVHNKLRFISFLQLCGVLVYAMLSEHVSLSDSSWLHAVHLVVQPLVFVSTLYQYKQLSVAACAAACVALCVDLVVAAINTVVIRRCYDDVNATCVQRTAASVLWLGLALVHCVLSYFGATGAFRAVALAKPAEVFEHVRIRIVCWYLFPQDVAYGLLTAPQGHQWFTLAHLLVNFTGVWISYRSTRKTVSLYYLFGGLVAVMLGLDVYGLEQTWGGKTFEDHLATLCYGVYLFTDVLLGLFTLGHVHRRTRKET